MNIDCQKLIQFKSLKPSRYSLVFLCLKVIPIFKIFLHDRLSHLLLTWKYKRIRAGDMCFLLVRGSGMKLQANKGFCLRWSFRVRTSLLANICRKRWILQLCRLESIELLMKSQLCGCGFSWRSHHRRLSCYIFLHVNAIPCLTCWPLKLNFLSRQAELIETGFNLMMETGIRGRHIQWH